MGVNILDCTLEHHRIVLCVTDHRIAVPTQESTDLVGRMAVIDGKPSNDSVSFFVLWLTANRTYSSLGGIHVPIRLQSYPKLCSQVPILNLFRIFGVI